MMTIGKVNGVTKIRMKIRKQIPSSMVIDSEKIEVYYKNQALACYKCGQAHTRRNCDVHDPNAFINRFSMEDFPALNDPVIVASKSAEATRTIPTDTESSNGVQNENIASEEEDKDQNKSEATESETKVVKESVIVIEENKDSNNEGIASNSTSSIVLTGVLSKPAQQLMNEIDEIFANGYGAPSEKMVVVNETNVANENSMVAEKDKDNEDNGTKGTNENNLANEKEKDDGISEESNDKTGTNNKNKDPRNPIKESEPPEMIICEVDVHNVQGSETQTASEGDDSVLTPGQKINKDWNQEFDENDDAMFYDVTTSVSELAETMKETEFLKDFMDVSRENSTKDSNENNKRASNKTGRQNPCHDKFCGPAL